MLGLQLMLVGGTIMLLTGIGDLYVNKLRDGRFEMDLDRGPDFSRGDLPPVGSGGEKSLVPQNMFVVGYLISFLVEVVGGLLYFQVI